MAALIPSTPRERRAFRLSALALLVALPLAVVASSYEDVMEWRSSQELNAIVAAPGKSAVYAGAEWRLERVHRLNEPGSAALVVIVEFEATVKDPAAFAATCNVALTDASKRRWKPQFLAPSIGRRVRPEAVDRPRCGSASLRAVKAGDTVRMAEAFVTPPDIGDIDLIVSLSTARPAYLVLD